MALKRSPIMAVPGAIASWRRVQTRRAELCQWNRKEGGKKYAFGEEEDSCTRVSVHTCCIHSCARLCMREGVHERTRDERKRAEECKRAREARSGREGRRKRDGESTKLETHYARSAPAVRRSGGQSDTAGS